MGKVKRQVCDEDHLKLYDITLKEDEEKGWLDGPFDPDQVSSMVGGQSVPVRRFGVWQKGKLRPIDDFKENRVNKAFTCGDKIDLHAMDHLITHMCAENSKGETVKQLCSSMVGQRLALCG